jgi:hypothetical protein
VSKDVMVAEDNIAPDDLKEPVAKLLSLLEDPHPGLSTWWEFLDLRIVEVHGLLDRALKKSGVVK